MLHCIKDLDKLCHNARPTSDNANNKPSPNIDNAPYLIDTSTSICCFSGYDSSTSCYAHNNWPPYGLEKDWVSMNAVVKDMNLEGYDEQGPYKLLPIIASR